jgi:MFS superfamily sulfate permease-like transporter
VSGGAPSGAPTWHVGDWGLLGWTETALKGAGALVGIGALLAALDRGPDAASGARLAGVVVLAVLSLGLVAGIADRLREREAVGFAFILAMVAGHLAMTVALARDESAGGALAAFAALMLAGDLVKLVFLRRTGFRVRAVPPAAVYGLTAAYAAGYVALLLIAPAV